MKLLGERANLSLFAMTKLIIFLSLFLSGCADTENIGAETRIEINEQRKQLEQELKSVLASKTTGRREVMIDVLSKSTEKELSKLRNGSIIGVYAWKHPMTGEVILDIQFINDKSTERNIKRVSILNDKGDISDITQLFKSQTDFRKIGLGSAWVGLPESILNINTKGTFSLKVEYDDENTGNSHPNEMSTVKIIDLQRAP